MPIPLALTGLTRRAPAGAPEGARFGGPFGSPIGAPIGAQIGAPMSWLSSERAATMPVPAPAARYAEFATLQEAYRDRGGIARGDVLASRMSATGRGGYIDLARRIVAGQLFAFKWHDSFWLPMFQFDPQSLALQEGPRRVLDVLRGTLDGWALSHWYVQPNGHLNGRRPLDLMEVDPGGVVAAAHATAPAGTDAPATP